ncbi:hypothetical protein [Paeniglutamicibacter terrestris]|uniref:Scaffolding protein n=1 Tax=Paeniglutamicibacter terrestris TaxID=2723403 RepID=A0ABX1G7J3_9MICC|nr:hypothetical protein [Paeniglutamicibacter terrestris]NKG22214.1 hypothetical protein [Paeniglutamicibacter terrestris]
MTEVKPDESAEVTPSATPEAVKPDEDAGGFKSKESKDAVLADLAEVRKELAAFKDREAEAEKAKLSDIERAQAETTERAKEAAEAKAELARYKVAAKHKITDADDLELLATAGDEAAMERLAVRLATAAAPGTPKPDPSGGPRNEKTGTLAEQIAAAEKAGDKSAVAVLKAQQLGALANNQT